MQKEKPLDNVIKLICERKLGLGIKGLENYLLSYPQVQGMDRLMSIKTDYLMMSEYWKRGIKDPERDKVYDQLLHRLYVLTMNICLSQDYRSNSYWTSLYNRPRKSNEEWGLTSVRNMLENFVGEMAMIDLEPEHVKKGKLEELNSSHYSYMSNLFDYVLTAEMWSEGVAEQFVDILLSPTVDSNDQQLIISAITLSALNSFDVNKVLALMSVYKKSTDIRVRQRALVGWALTIDEKKATLYPEMQYAISEICTDESVCQELTELQMQLFYCKEAETDQQKIRDEIMPDIMNSGRIKMTQRGLEEMDEDTLDDILHPDAAERDMEKMEQSVQRMADMQKQGSDIYFAGFSQMKRFPFFNELSNWLVPFYADHPAISKLWNNTKSKKFLHSIMSMGAFCDGDKYSFVLAFEQVIGHLPEQMVKMVEEGEASPLPIGGVVDEEEKRSPAYIRRMYLQDLYRIFRLYPMRNEFCNPFDDREDYLFCANSLFASTALKKRIYEVASFLIKHQQYTDAESVLDNYPEENWDYQFFMLKAHILHHNSRKDWIQEKTLYQEALKRMPGDRKALVGLARALYEMGTYDEALEIYKQLLENNPDSKSYMLNAAICMVNVRQSAEALKLLFKLNYLYPEDMLVVHVLAWALTLETRYEEALKHFEQLMTQTHPFSDNFLNYGYCLWFMGNILEAAKTFHRYLEFDDKELGDLETAFKKTEHDILVQHQINDTEIQMMLDAARG